MSRRSSAAGKMPQPPGSKGVELSRSARPPHLSGSTSKAPRTRKSFHFDDNNARETEPATDEDGQRGGSTELERIQNLDTVERQAIDMLKTITKRSEKNHQRYGSFRGIMSGKNKQIDELHASYKDLARQTAGLEALCNMDMDEKTLEELFQSIPVEQRLLHFTS